MSVKFEITAIRDAPGLADAAAGWFSEKWGVPYSEYLESIAASIERPGSVPQWYLVLLEGRIIAGCGIISNDFHQRPDLTPNLCALFVEEPYRNLGCARALLKNARREAGAMGFDYLYLVTDHTEFYERCGWEFLTMVAESDGGQIRMYRAATRL